MVIDVDQVSLLSKILVIFQLDLLYVVKQVLFLVNEDIEDLQVVKELLLLNRDLVLVFLLGALLLVFLRDVVDLLLFLVFVILLLIIFLLDRLE